MSCSEVLEKFSKFLSEYEKHLVDSIFATPQKFIGKLFKIKWKIIAPKPYQKGDAMEASCTEDPFLTSICYPTMGNFKLQYKYSKVIDANQNKEFTTVFLNSKDKYYIITDSIVSKINETELCFYFLTPQEDEINLQCPSEYGIIVIDKDNNEIYTSFWNHTSNLELKGNCLPSINHYKSTKGMRSILCLGNSGCGSGGSLTYFDINLLNNKIRFKEVFSCGGGYSDFLFIPEKNIYLKIERINPECHYSCPSRYKISSYSLTNDILLKSNLTKYMYDDYNDIGIEALLKNIQIKEPNTTY
jgi:hypothetical protein